MGHFFKAQVIADFGDGPVGLPEKDFGLLCDPAADKISSCSALRPEGSSCKGS